MELDLWLVPLQNETEVDSGIEDSEGIDNSGIDDDGMDV